MLTLSLTLGLLRFKPYPYTSFIRQEVYRWINKKMYYKKIFELGDKREFVDLTESRIYKGLQVFLTFVIWVFL